MWDTLHQLQQELLICRTHLYVIDWNTRLALALADPWEWLHEFPESDYMNSCFPLDVAVIDDPTNALYRGKLWGWFQTGFLLNLKFLYFVWEYNLRSTIQTIWVSAYTENLCNWSPRKLKLIYTRRHQHNNSK